MTTMLSETIEVDGPPRPTNDDLADHVASLREMTELLCPRDRILIELVASGQRSLREVARLTDESPGKLSRKLRLLWLRLHSPFVRHLFDPRCKLRSDVRRLGAEKYLIGLTNVEIAEKHNIPLADVVKTLQFLRGYALAKGLNP